MRKLITIFATLALALSLVASPAAAKSHPTHDKNKSDYRPNARAQKYDNMKTKAREMVLKGQAKAKGANKVVKVAKGQYVELAFQGEDKILTILGEFGDAQATHAHGALGSIAHGGTPGPVHNQIPQPDRTVDNTTIWEPDFNRAYYQNLLFNKTQRPSMANWYLAASDGRYSVTGYVSDWVQVDFNSAAYGSNYCGSIVCTRDIGRFVEDQVDTWWDDLVAEKGSEAAANAWLQQFDVWDRYDFDHDSNFDEPDGYIDHFQSVHAGIGEETCNPGCPDAIWSHRSNINSIPSGIGQGPTVNGQLNDTGGAQIGDSHFWIDDYTIEPENGGVGVFAHEFGHDLGLPDEYDTGGNTGFGENSTGWWTTWSQGSYGTIGQDLGTYPVHMTSWEKLVLGWLHYDLASAGDSGSYKISALETNTKQAQALIVLLPDKEVSKFVGDPIAGDWFYHGGSGNDLNNTMTKEFTLGAGPITATFDARYHIEPCWDYAYLEVSTDGGTSWDGVHTSASDDPSLNANNQNDGEGISGVSGHTLACDDNLNLDPEVVSVTADLTAYANSTIQLRFRYWTDGATIGDGFGVDNLTITGVTNPAVDDAEADYGWTYDGFVRTTGTVTSSFFNLYMAEYRTYKGYDKALKVGPYNFPDPEANWVEHFPYQDGMLIWYYDTSQGDNNVSEHPGEGLILPIDARPGIIHWTGSGQVARARIQAYDATFGPSKTDPISLHSIVYGTITRGAKPAVRTFNDRNSYWVASDPADASSNYKAGWSSVKNPHTGTVIKVASISAQGSFMQILLNP